MPLNLAELGKIYTIHRIGGQEFMLLRMIP